MLILPAVFGTLTPQTLKAFVDKSRIQPKYSYQKIVSENDRLRSGCYGCSAARVRGTARSRLSRRDRSRSSRPLPAPVSNTSPSECRKTPCSTVQRNNRCNFIYLILRRKKRLQIKEQDVLAVADEPIDAPRHRKQVVNKSYRALDALNLRPVVS